MEIWKDITDYEGLYQVSTFGRVKSLTREVKHWRGGLRIIKEKVLRTKSKAKTYLTVTLCNEGIETTRQVHQLVAIAFLNHIPCGNKIEVDHINSIKLDNRLENLQILSSREHKSKTAKQTVNKTSVFTGVSWEKQQSKWKAQIQFNGKKKHIGLFVSETDASDAYQTALKELEK